MPPKKHIEVESSSSSMEKLTRAVSQLFTSINQIQIAVIQTQTTIAKMEIRLNNLENDCHGSNYQCADKILAQIPTC